MASLLLRKYACHSTFKTTMTSLIAGWNLIGWFVNKGRANCKKATHWQKSLALLEVAGSVDKDKLFPYLTWTYFTKE